MNDVNTPSQARLIGLMAIFVLAAVPLVAVLWEALNELLALKVDSSLLLAVPAALLFAGLLYIMSRTLRKNGARSDGSQARPAGSAPSP